VIAAVAGPTALAAPGRLGAPRATEDALRYLSALGDWREQRRAELDVLDKAPSTRRTHRPSPGT
jgi:hypothetical protein